MPRALLILLIFAVAAAGCEKKDPTAPGGGPSAVEKPTVSTAPVTGITITTATAGGEVTADGGAPITARGVTWSTSSNPTVSGARTADGTGTGAFASEIQDLSPGGTYFVRAYATNSAGTAYGDDVSFTTEEGEYAIIVLGRVSGDYATLGNALNEQCHVAGSWYRGGNLFGAYVWAPATGFRRIGWPEYGSAHAINEEGIVAGTLADLTYTWTEASGLRSYEPAPGFTSSMASAINSHGVLTGESLLYGAQGSIAEVAATLWGPDGRAVLLRNNLGGWSNARDINDAGMVVGYGGTDMNAVAWRAPDAIPVILPQGEEQQFGHVAGQAWGINNQEDIVGVVGSFAALWRGDQRVFLPALPGHGAATARSVTEPDAAGVIRVVGWSQVSWGPSVERRPVIWTVDGSDIQVAELYPPAGHLSAIAKDVKILQGEVVVVGTSYTSASSFAVMWSTSRDVCGF